MGSSHFQVGQNQLFQTLIFKRWLILGVIKIRISLSCFSLLRDWNEEIRTVIIFITGHKTKHTLILTFTMLEIGCIFEFNGKTG